MHRSTKVPWRTAVFALAVFTSACSRSIEVWQAPLAEEPPKTLSPLKGVPFFVKVQRYKHTKSEEHRWYRVKLTATAVFEASQERGGRSQTGATGTGTIMGTPTVHVLDAGREKRDSILAALSDIRSLNATSGDGEPDAAAKVDSLIKRFVEWSEDPYGVRIAGEPISLGTTIEPVVVIDYGRRYYVNSGRSLGSSKLNVTLAGDGTLTSAEADVAGSLREVTGAISDVATPVGDILSGVAAIRQAGGLETALMDGQQRKVVGYILEVTIAEAGYRDDYVLLSDSTFLRDALTRETPGVSHTRRWFEGSGSNPEAEEENGPTIDFRGSVKLPTPDQRDGKAPR